MNHSDHVSLLKKLPKAENALWADLGSGWGAFTLALRDVMGESVNLYSIDKDNSSLQEQQKHFETQFPGTKIEYIHKDFTGALKLPLLDGILMANSLHYIRDQKVFLNSLRKYLKPTGIIAIIEYDTDRSNFWLPYPKSMETLKQLVQEIGFSDVKELGYNEESQIYSIVVQM
jgi:ubiquinone/menaquinone biosynthesis C-methylase UbiE